MWLSLQILFVYLLTLPSLLHPSIYSTVFYTCFCSFFIALNVTHQCHLHGLPHSTLNGPACGRWEFTRARKIRSHAPHVPMPRQADKEAAQIAMRSTLPFKEKILSFVGSSYPAFIVTEVLSWLLTAEGARYKMEWIYTRIKESSQRYVNSVDWNGGMEWWSGLLEWSTGLDYWSATPP